MENNDNNTDDIINVCRLCLGGDDLISIFDDREKIPANIINVVQVTTGVTIKSSDNVSQKLCNKCLNITVKMFKFRSSSIINDMELKSKASRKLNPVLDESVEVLLRKYPKIVLPSSISKINISPIVKINKNEIVSGKHNLARKANKKRREPLKLDRKQAIQSVLPEVTDLENRITSYVIQNKEIPVQLQLSKSTEAVQQNLMPTLSADVPTLTSEIDDPLKLPQENISSSDVDETISESIMATEIRDNKSKRKLSDSKNSKEPKRFKSGTDSVNTGNSLEPLVTLKYVTKTLLICDICNGILYNAKDLKKHKTQHMKCHLCKMSFRSLEETNKHSESGCTIKKIISNLPKILLKRCDESEEFRKQYPPLIGGFNKTIKGVEVCSPSLVEPKTNYPEEFTIDHDEVETVEMEQAAFSLDVKQETKSFTECSLISDDENEVDQPPNNRDVNQISYNSEIGKSKSVSPNNNMNNPLKDKSAGSPINNSIAKKTKTSQILSSATVIPNINIIGDNILNVNLDETEINLLRNILKRTRKRLREKYVQTDIPCNADIRPCPNKDDLFELRNLRKFLTFHKIPVNLCFAPQYSVKFSFEPSPSLEKVSSWSKIIPKITTASKTLTVNNSPKKNTMNNITPYDFPNNIPPQALSSPRSVLKPISSISSILGVQPTTDQQPGIGMLRIESISGVATSLEPTVLHSSNSAPCEIKNNNPTQGLSNNFSLRKPISSINSILDLQSKINQQPSIGNLRRKCNFVIAASLAPTMLHTTTSSIQSNTTLSIVQPPILSSYNVMNRNSYSETEVQMQSYHNSMIPQKNANYNQLDHSLPPQILTNLTSHHGVKTTYFPSNDTVPKYVTGELSMNNNIKVSQIIRTSSSAYALPLIGVNNITSDGINCTSYIENVFSRSGSSVIEPTTGNSEVSSFTQTQKIGSLASSTITSNTENHSGSDFPPTIRVKDMSDLR